MKTVSDSVFVFFNDTATTEIYTLSLHDALPISSSAIRRALRRAVPLKAMCSMKCDRPCSCGNSWRDPAPTQDRKSTRLNSSHANISYAVFCLKKKTSALVSDRLFHTHDLPFIAP